MFTSLLLKRVVKRRYQFLIATSIRSDKPNQPESFCSMMATKTKFKCVYVCGRFLKYESLPGSSQPCYEREVMIDTVLDAHRGSISRENSEVMMRRGMKPSPNNPDKYYYSRDSRLKVRPGTVITQRPNGPIHLLCNLIFSQFVPPPSM